MQIELVINNDPRTLPGVSGLLQAALAQLPLDTADATAIARVTESRVKDAVATAYPPGEHGTIRLTVREQSGRLEIQVRDFGMPQDVAELERRLHASADDTSSAPVDEIHWLGYGREGKAFQLIKWLHDEHITQSAAAGDLSPFSEEVALAPQQTYEVRPMRRDEAVQVSQLMYRTYGNTYFNEDVYYPERVAAQNENGSVLSFVAVAEDGVVAGHYALEFNQPGPVAEGGQAVVDPAHRGRGLLERMKAASLEAAVAHQLKGWYADAVAVHLLTQKSNAEHGGHLTCADLAIAPRSEAFRHIAAEQPQRVSCLLYFHWLQAPGSRQVSVPDRHRAMISRIYSGLGCDFEFVPPQAAPSAEHGVLAVQQDSGGAKAFIRVEQLGMDTVSLIAQAKRGLVERQHMEAVYVELPLSDPACASVMEVLEGEGFGLIGILPDFSPQGDLLRMVYLVEPLEREPIKTYEPFGGELVDYALAEQKRLRAQL